MDAKEYLSQIRKLKYVLEMHKDTLARFEELAFSAGGSASYEPHYGKRQPLTEAPFVKYVDKILYWEKVVEEDENKLEKLVIEVESQISKIEDQVIQNILRLRYVFSLNWKEVQRQLHYSPAVVYREHRKGLSLIAVPVNMQKEKDDSK